MSVHMNNVSASVGADVCVWGGAGVEGGHFFSFFNYAIMYFCVAVLELSHYICESNAYFKLTLSHIYVMLDLVT